ncbi:hypothetical protein J2736_000285 [Paenibacillus qinlingensis]|uniref:Uncharacterized protein n=1 Tax=Paenibacillus qinlingensis TaxID=1837343 RepID=A0ABU1NNR4_9BACL|nr:hypothetical protein [Paenibacillus qinlingensis]
MVGLRNWYAYKQENVLVACMETALLRGFFYDAKRTPIFV